MADAMPSSGKTAPFLAQKTKQRDENIFYPSVFPAIEQVESTQPYYVAYMTPAMAASMRLNADRDQSMEQK
jgi:hypothetical protein